MYISNLVLIGISYLQLRTYILYIFLNHATIVSLVKILTSSHIRVVYLSLFPYSHLEFVCLFFTDLTMEPGFSGTSTQVSSLNFS